MSQSNNHMPQLDGLRAVACGAVVFSHFAPEDHLLMRLLPWGGIGVQLFFVLSGFLITRILLSCRERMTEGHTGMGELRTFYARRFLRIFPIYYLVLAVLFVIGYGIMRESILWHVLYLQNLWRAFYEIHFINHLWSLAVEEQFYLCWPWLVLFLPRRALLPSIVGMIILAMAFRLLAWGSGWSYLYLNIFTLSNLDTLGVGALLAWCWHNPNLRALPGRLAWVCLPAGLALFAALAVLRWNNPTDWPSLYLGLGTASVLTFVPLVHGAATGLPSLPGLFLSLPPLQYLGKISYGLYLIHPLIKHLYNWVSANHLALPTYWPLRFVLLTAISIALASLSWHLFESPINRLKNRFPY